MDICHSWPLGSSITCLTDGSSLNLSTENLKDLVNNNGLLMNRENLLLYRKALGHSSELDCSIRNAPPLPDVYFPEEVEGVSAFSERPPSPAAAARAAVT